MRLLLLIILLLISACSNVFYQPSPKHFVSPEQFKLDYQDLYFKSSDGTTLNAWFFPARGQQRPKGTIVQFHGNAQNISTHFFSLIWVIEQGYNLFTFDYRGYAKSEGSPNQRGIYLDALAAFEKAYELNKSSGNGKFIIYGQSTGGAIALRALPDYQHVNDVDLIVMDSAFASYQDIAFDKLKSRWFLWPFSPLAYLLISDKFAADEVFHKITRPTLVIVGERDQVVPAKFGKSIYKGVASQKKWLWSLPNGGHIDAYHHDGNIYRQQLLDLIEQLDQ